MNLTESVKKKAAALGFDLAGVTTAEAISPDEIAYLRRWLDEGRASGMDYMSRNFDKRVDPSVLLEGARSVICVGLSYKLSYEERRACCDVGEGPFGRVADFALFDDYHVFMKMRLRQLAEYIDAQVAPEKWKCKVCVDSVPIAERSIARRAGLGFVGKNHMLTNERLGSQILLGLLISTLELEPDQPTTGDCHGCKKCIKACPTGALQDGGFDSAKCISYLTIEHKGNIPEELASKTGDRIFGCDECTKACPHTQNAPSRRNTEFALDPNRALLPLNEILDWSQQDFDRYFAGSTVERLGLERLKRNARLSIEN